MRTDPEFGGICCSWGSEKPVTYVCEGRPLGRGVVIIFPQGLRPEEENAEAVSLQIAQTLRRLAMTVAQRMQAADDESKRRKVSQEPDMSPVKSLLSPTDKAIIACCNRDFPEYKKSDLVRQKDGSSLLEQNTELKAAKKKFHPLTVASSEKIGLVGLSTAATSSRILQEMRLCQRH